MTRDIFGELPKYHDDKTFYSTQPKPASLDSLFASDTINKNSDGEKSGKDSIADINTVRSKKIIEQPQLVSKYDKKNIKKKTEEKNYFIKYAFVDLLKDPSFVSDFDKAIANYKEEQKEKDYEETEAYKKAERKLERREKRTGIALGLNKIVIVNPSYYKIDANQNNPVKLVASEMAQKDLNNSIKNNASLAGLNYELIDMKDLHANSADLFNDLSVLNNYLSEVEKHGDMHFVNYMTDDIQALTRKYGTNYFDWTGVLCYREHSDYRQGYLKTMFLIFSVLYFPITPYAIYNAFRVHHNTYIFSEVYDLSKGETLHSHVSKVKFRDRPDVLNSILYDLYLQYKKAKKS